MTTIPDDIMQAAKAAYNRTTIACVRSHPVDLRASDITAIALAILAERERCAKVAETCGSILDHPSIFMGGPSRESRRKVGMIAAAIRNGEQ